MNTVRPIGTVTLPPSPRSGMDVLRYLQANQRALEQLRDRLILVPHSRGGTSVSGSSAYVPWKPVFTFNDPNYTVRFNLGTLNNVAPTNWDADHTLSTDVIRFVMLEVTSADGLVTGLEIVLETSAPTVDTVAKDTPPTLHKILLGAISQTSGDMIETTNLNAIATEIYRESKESPAAGAEPFSRWWRWNHTQV